MAESETFTAAVVTVSDSCARGEREDRSGPAVAELLEKLRFSVVAREVVPDDSIQIQNLLIRLSREVRLVVTTGGTGIAPRDVTPEATAAVCDRLVEGVAECMRREGVKKTPFAALSRGVCGVRGTALILNLPGSPAGAVESLLPLETWDEIVLANPVLREMEADVMGLLANRVRSSGPPHPAEYYLVPIDQCYKVVGLIRSHWRGLSGGTEVWREIGTFFAELGKRAKTRCETGHV